MEKDPDPVRKFTKEELDEQQEFDGQVYNSLRASFETILYRTIDKAKRGEPVDIDVAVLLKAYTDASNNSQRLINIVRRNLSAP